jgi:hypothetical protein
MLLLENRHRIPFQQPASRQKGLPIVWVCFLARLGEFVDSRKLIRTSVAKHFHEAVDVGTAVVAFSRAKNRVVFTFCEHRAKPADTPLEAQQRTRIGPLDDLLEQAGVRIEHITE